MKLSRESARLFDSIKSEYGIKDEAGILLLQTVCESLDLMRVAEKEIQKNGIVVYDRYKQPKPNPACQVLRDSKSAMLQSLKQLNLDIEVKTK